MEGFDGLCDWRCACDECKRLIFVHKFVVGGFGCSVCGKEDGKFYPRFGVGYLWIIKIEKLAVWEKPFWHQTGFPIVYDSGGDSVKLILSCDDTGIGREGDHDLVFQSEFKFGRDNRRIAQ